VIDFGHVWGNMRNSTDIVSTQMGKTGASWSPTIGGRNRIWYDRSPFIVEELYHNMDMVQTLCVCTRCLYFWLDSLKLRCSWCDRRKWSFPPWTHTGERPIQLVRFHHGSAAGSDRVPGYAGLGSASYLFQTSPHR